MTKRGTLLGAVACLALGLGRPEAQAGPIARRLQGWAQNQPEVYTAQPSQTKHLDVNLAPASFSDRVRRRLPWHRSQPLTSGVQTKVEYMKHGKDGQLIR